MKLASEYLRDRYNEEQSRFDHLENKCSKLLSFSSVVIAAITAIASAKSGAIFHPGNAGSWLGLIAYIFGALAVVCSWAHALAALKIGDYTVLPKSKKTADYLISLDEETAAKHIYQCYTDSLEKLTIEIDEKSRQLTLAYNDIVFSAWCLGGGAVVFTYIEMTK
ncbi:MAG: hypothetical protein Q7U82_16825 [Gammaproteobacteria bacterium]|nr:hypothetical protein [Gammaproteobacteria bacterium]